MLTLIRGVDQLAIFTDGDGAFGARLGDHYAVFVQIAIEIGIVRRDINFHRLIMTCLSNVIARHWCCINRDSHSRFVGDVTIAVFDGVFDGVCAVLTLIRGVDQLAIFTNRDGAFGARLGDHHAVFVQIAVEVGIVRGDINFNWRIVARVRFIFIRDWRLCDINGHGRFVGHVAIFIFNQIRNGVLACCIRICGVHQLTIDNFHGTFAWLTHNF